MSIDYKFLVPGPGFSAHRVTKLSDFEIQFPTIPTYYFHVTVSENRIAVTEGKSRALVGFIHTDITKEGLLSTRGFWPRERFVHWDGREDESFIKDVTGTAQRQMKETIYKVGLAKFVDSVEQAVSIRPADLEAAYLV